MVNQDQKLESLLSLFGLYLVEFENAGGSRSEVYGVKLLSTLSKSLSERMGRGWSKRTLELYRKFYLTYPEIAQTASAQSFLSWSH